jgi:hypothetical protein
LGHVMIPPVDYSFCHAVGVEEGSPLHIRHCIQVEHVGGYMPALCGECVRVDLMIIALLGFGPRKTTA